MWAEAGADRRLRTRPCSGEKRHKAVPRTDGKLDFGTPQDDALCTCRQGLGQHADIPCPVRPSRYRGTVCPGFRGECARLPGAWAGQRPPRPRRLPPGLRRHYPLTWHQGPPPASPRPRRPARRRAEEPLQPRDRPVPPCLRRSRGTAGPVHEAVPFPGKRVAAQAVASNQRASGEKHGSEGRAARHGRGTRIFSCTEKGKCVMSVCAPCTF